MAGHTMNDNGDRPRWRRDLPIGALIEQVRSEAGKSQEALVIALGEASGNTGVDKKSVSRWEHGKRIPTPYWRVHLSAVLGIPVDVLDRAAAVTREQRRANRHHRTAASATAPGGNGASMEVAPGMAVQRGNGLPSGLTGAFAGRVRVGDGQDHGVAISAQRAFMTLPDASTAEVEPERLCRVMRDPNRVDDATVGHLEVVTDSHRTLYHALSSFELIHIIRGHLRGVIGLLRGHQPDALRRRLAAIACETAGHAGWLAHDLDDQAASKRYYATAVVIAKETGDLALGAYVRGFMSIVHGIRHQPVRALALARSARAEAGRSASATTRSWLDGLVAQGLAAHDDRTACLAALKDAERALEQSRPDQDPAWQYSFDRGRFQALAGGCYWRLGMTVLAERTLQDALAALEPSCARRRSEVLLGLAQVGLQRRDIDQACAYAAEALASMTEARSVAGVQQVHQFRVNLEPWRGAAAVADLDEQLSATL